MLRKILLIFGIFLFLPLATQGASLDVVINEVAWMGTNNSANDEWIELYNNTANSINLEEWVLKAIDGTPEINLTGRVLANGFYLLERTDETTIPGISANLIYKGVLGNDGENLKLCDGSGNLIDEVNCGDGWFAGDNSTKQTMERKNILLSGNDSLNWRSSEGPGGTPKTKNSTPGVVTPPAETGSPPAPGIDVNYPSGVVFSEILPSPEGADTENEWIEIFNQNSFEVNLSGWKIQDSEGRTTTYTFPAGTEISPEGYLVLSRPTTKITLNNTGDELNLIQPNGKIIDLVTYEKAPINQSYNRAESGWIWSENLTPGKANIIPGESSPSFRISEDKEEKSEYGPLAAKFLSEKGVSGIGEKLPKSLSLSPFLITFIVAIFSGIAILFLKKQLDRMSPTK